MPGNESMRAWRPAVPGVREVLHAHMEGHRYPSHAHGDWALMVIDQGAVAYDLGGRARIADGGAATLLPPGVAHDGRAAPRSAGFRKRVAYLDAAWVSEELSGSVVDRPARADLLASARRLHDALGRPGYELAAEVALLDIAALVGGGRSGHLADRSDHSLAARLRDLLESRLLDGTTLAEAGAALGAHPGHLSRSFSSAYGIPPHRYLTSRRVDVARRLLLSGRSPAEAATLAGFYDQAHLTRHFRRVLGATPVAFAKSASGER